MTPLEKLAAIEAELASLGQFEDDSRIIAKLLALARELAERVEDLENERDSYPPYGDD